MPVLLALCSALTYGVGDYLGGRASRVQPSVVVAFVGQVLSLVLVSVALLFIGTPTPDAASWWWSAFGGVMGALGIAGLYHGFAHGEMTVVAPVSAVVGAVVPAAAGIIDGERPSALAMVGIVVAVGAVALVSGALGTHQHSTPRRIVALAVFVGFCFGLLFVAFDQASNDAGLWPLAIARFASVPMLLVLALAIRGRPVRHRGSLGLSAVTGVIDSSSNGLYLMATHGGLLSVVAVVASLYPASTVALAASIDKERIGRSQAIGMGLAVAAVVLVTVSRS